MGGFRKILEFFCEKEVILGFTGGAVGDVDVAFELGIAVAAATFCKVGRNR